MSIYIGDFDTDGISKLLNFQDATAKSTVSSPESLYDEEAASAKSIVDRILPEREKIQTKNDTWAKDSILRVVKDNTEITVSFISEGAGYRNAFAVGIIRSDSKYSRAAITKSTQLDDVFIIFPNASAAGSGGRLKSGDTMKIPRDVSVSTATGNRIGTPTNYIFNAGDIVVPILFSNGWNGAYVSKYAETFYGISNLNSEKAHWLRHHFFNIKVDDISDGLVMGCEDIQREKSYCDHDANDLVLLWKVSSDLSHVSEDSYVKEVDMPVGAPEKYTLGYKKIFCTVEEGKVQEAIAELYIPSTSKIVKTIDDPRKLKTDRAYVSKIIGCPNVTDKTNLTTKNYIGRGFDAGHSGFDKTFGYEKEKYVEELSFDEANRLPGNGIHFFGSSSEAKEYKRF